MTRIASIAPERMSEAQRHLHERVAKTGRGASGGPWAVLLHVPEVGERLAAVVEQLMAETRVAQKLKRLAVLTIAQAYGAQYEWAVHEPRARFFGLDETIIEALRTGARPEFLDANDALVYTLARQLAHEHALDTALHQQAVRALGDEAVVELVALVGFYIGLAVLLVAYDVPAPNGATPLPARA